MNTDEGCVARSMQVAAGVGVDSFCVVLGVDSFRVVCRNCAAQQPSGNRIPAVSVVVHGCRAIDVSESSITELSNHCWIIHQPWHNSNTIDAAIQWNRHDVITRSLTIESSVNH